MGIAIKLNQSGRVVEAHNSVHTPDYGQEYLINPSLPEGFWDNPYKYQYVNGTFAEVDVEVLEQEAVNKAAETLSETVAEVQIPNKILMNILIEILVEQGILAENKIQEVRDSYGQKARTYLSSLL